METQSAINKLNFKWCKRFVIGTAQDYKTKEILMCAFMNKEAVKRTLETGYAHYYSTTRKKAWKKGETSGNTQKMVKIIPDCDNNTLLIIVKQKGVACHTGNKTCFYKKSLK